jgi:hypothetical protein
VAASFTSPTDGWVIGVLVRYGRTTVTYTYRVIHTRRQTQLAHPIRHANDERLIVLPCAA